MNASGIDREAVVGIICETAKEIAPGAPAMDEGTRLFGSQGFLDSLGLVSLVLDIEQRVNDLYSLSLSLADDRSVSQVRSPFRSVGSLADYVLKLAFEKQGG